MALASTSAVQLGYIQEAQFGVLPITGNAKKLRMVGESLDFAISKEMSKEINATRTISTMSAVSASASGGMQAEMQYGEYDTLLAATLQNTYNVYGTGGVGTSFTADFTATTITASVAPTGSSAFTGLQKGQWFRVSAGANANHGKLLRVSTTVAPTSTVITLDANTVAVASLAVAGVALQSSRLTHGTVQSSFSIERQATDVGQFFAYRGMTPSKVDLSISTGSLSSINFDFMGKDVVRAATTNLPGTPVDSYSYDIHSGVSNTAACQVWIGDTPLSGTFAQSISLSYDNALRTQEAICTLGAIGIGSGTINCTAEVELYFSDGVLFDQFVANTNVQIIFSSIDSSGAGYVITLPACNISSYKVTAGAKDGDLMASVSFTALRHEAASEAGLKKLIFVDRVGPALV